MKIIIIFYIYNAALTVTSLGLKTRIVGGEIVEDKVAHAQPTYVASLLIDGRFVCAATLITRGHLLTAAHCVSNLIALQETSKAVAVLMGSPKLYHGTHHTVRKITHHYGFQRSVTLIHTDNIAVIHLRRPVTITRKIQPINLPPRSLVTSLFTQVVITGYGGQFRSQSPSIDLSKIQLTTAPIELCQQKFLSDLLTEKHLCTMSITGFGCSIGDDGSPMVDINEKIILGITSFGTYGCNTGIPDIFTKVSYYIDYIEGEIRYYEENHSYPSIIFPEQPPYIFQ